MSWGVAHDHQLIMHVGEEVINLKRGILREVLVIEYLDKFLPSIRLYINDAEGILGHILPFDGSANKLTVSFRNIHFAAPQGNYEATFDIFRREPTSFMQTSGHIGCTGLLSSKNLFSPCFERGWSTLSIKDILTKIAIEELGCNKVDISPSLDIIKPVVQPRWTNSQFFVYLQRNLYGSDIGGFFIYIIVEGNKKIFVVKNVKELLAQHVKSVFITGPNPEQDARPLFEFDIIDNYKLSQVFGTAGQMHGNFNFSSGRFEKNVLNLDDTNFESLSQYHMVDKEDKQVGLDPELGYRTSDFIPDYKPVFEGRFQKRLIGLTKMWVTIEGNPTYHPGDIIKIVFVQPTQDAGMFSYQYAGYWLIERVVHWFTTTYATRLLLTRNGVETDMKTSLREAKNWKRENVTY